MSRRSANLTLRPGFPSNTPFGANCEGDGVHFTIFSRHATKVWLLLFDHPDDPTPAMEFELDPATNRTGDIWHAWVSGLRAGQLYLWRMDGPWNPEKGHRFDKNVYLLDPCAKALTSDFDWKGATARDEENPLAVRFTGEGARHMPKCVAVTNRFYWEDDRPLCRPLSETIIYECHVRGLTAHESSGVEHPGTFSGVVEKIPYFQELGITALELLPVNEFSTLQESFRVNPETGEPLVNYWGYNSVSFFAPNGRYSSRGALGGQVEDFKVMVRELHKAGIEVILDVVFNHTAEGGEVGPTLCFKGIDNSIYYLLDKKTGEYRDYTGCGNTFNCNHPVVRSFIRMCLRYWVLHMHVDGFRFDLASVLGRDEDGELMPNPPLLQSIEEDPILRGTKIIAEAWDAAGAYQVGDFSGRWAEWNGKFRDDVRRYWRGDPGSVGPLATRLAGSSDLYGDDGRTPHHSINFITSHDGFTLNDWASYEKKQNRANGEQNRDGDNFNLSLNHGEEGRSHTKEVRKVRARQLKNMFATLMLSLGVPMMLGGDEFRRTQKGNNNAYCQDNEVSWHNWRMAEGHKEMLRFVRLIIAFRKRHPSLLRRSFYTGTVIAGHRSPDICWLGEKRKQPDWNGRSLALGALIDGHYGEDTSHEDHDLLILFNGNQYQTWFETPPPPNGGKWRIAINTQRPMPEDIYREGKEPILGETNKFKLKERSLAVLIADCLDL